MDWRVSIGILIAGSLALAQSIPQGEASTAFALARQISDRDGGETWGIPVCGPMLFADSVTGDLAANGADAEGRLQPAGDVWRGKLPKSMHVANTAIEFGGVRWTMVAWPLPEDMRSRARLLAHECYHRIQPALKLPANDVMNTHLDTTPGRIWMLLEWRALERALAERGELRKHAVADALRFREYRRSLIDGVADSENALEMNEGLAEYTGVRLANVNEADRRITAILALHNAPQRSSFVRSFAYASGPAYGVLLDESGKTWRRTLTPTSDLSAFLATAYHVKVGRVDERAALAAARAYDGDAVIAVETRRASKIASDVADMRRLFVDGPVLLLPAAANINFSFDPNGVFALNESSVVYRPLRVSDRWGSLEASAGMIVRENGAIRRVVVTAPTNTVGDKLAGEGWKLQLQPGFKVGPGLRAGDFVVEEDSTTPAAK
jgi:hypothetical protein